MSVASLASLILYLLSGEVVASELTYFDKKIDYWNESAKEKPGAASTPSEKSSEFPWKTYLDPKNKEFFKEGDYTPPEPFMEVARNPTDENIKSWFDLMAKKNELSSRLQQRMREYIAKNQAGQPMEATPPSSNPLPAVRRTVSQKAKADPSRFHIRMYFDSNCPHCKRMFGVLEKLQAEGYNVEALQVDDGPVPASEKVVPIGKANPQELKARGVQGVPFILVADLKRKALLPPIEGYHDYSEVSELLRTASN